jgi:RimJ/RimL family protein N-acetyltransferase
VDADVARHGIGGLATSMMLDFGFGPAGLTRITAPISPVNVATSRGAAQIGFEREAMMTRYFDVGGARRDHELWAVTKAAVPSNGFAQYWIDSHTTQHPASSTTKELAATDSRMRTTTVLVATARYYAGRIRHLLDPLGPPPAVRLTDTEDPAVVLRTRRLSDWAQWRAARIRARGALDPNPDAPDAAWERQHTRMRWLREFLGSHAGLRSARGLVLAIEIDGLFAGECRLFDLDMFDRNARQFDWTDPDIGGDRVRTTAIRLLLSHAFTTLGLCRVATAIEPSDLDSAEIAARVGMVREGRMHCYVGATGRRADHDLWAVTMPAEQA